MSRSLLRKRDLGAICVFLIGVYISLSAPRFNYSLQPTFYLNLAWNDGGRIHSDWNLLPPVVTDLDGDGQQDLLFITPDMTLRVFSTERPSSLNLHEAYTPEHLRSVELKTMNIQQGRTPVLMRTGYITEYSPTRTREQVVVIVREDLTITCYDSKLKMLWEKSLSHGIHFYLDKFEVNEASMSISPLGVNEDTTAVVILGVSYRRREELDDEVDIEQIEETDLEKGGEKMELEGEGDDSKSVKTKKAEARLEHFNIYCFDAHTGKMIWLHDGIEVRTEEYTKSLPQHAYKLDVSDLMGQLHRAPGLSDWTTFRNSLIRELPHAWKTPEDTSMNYARFTKKHMGAGAGHQGPRAHKGSSRKSVALAQQRQADRRRGQNSAASERRYEGTFSKPLSYDSVFPHDPVEHEHKEYPNVLVVHTSRGLEVVSLLTGTPITSLALPLERLHADLDGDGIVDSILVLESEEDVGIHNERFGHTYESVDNDLKHCSIMVLSGLPVHSQLFNISICSNQNSLHESISRNKVPSVISAATPLVLRKINPNTRKEMKVRDLVTAINEGTITSVNGQGIFNWQIKDGPTWDLDYDMPNVLSFDPDAYRAYDYGTHDTLFSHILVNGDNLLALISRNGEILTTVDVPQPPIAKPVFVDFNSDGLSDVMVLSRYALMGYELDARASVQSLFIAFIFLACLATLLFLSSIRDDTGVPVGSLSDSDGTGGFTSKGVFNRFGTKRSTDEAFHLD